MNDARLAELEGKYKNRDLFEELKWGIYWDHSGYTRKQDGEFLNWLCLMAYRALKEKQGEWIPVKDRPMTTEERIEFAKHYGIEYCDTADEKVLDCPMPEDRQEILVSSRWGVHTDVADNDIDGEGFISYGLEGNGDWEGIDAWMPLPKPYKEGEE